VSQVSFTLPGLRFCSSSYPASRWALLFRRYAARFYTAEFYAAGLPFGRDKLRRGLFQGRLAQALLQLFWWVGKLA
jgi:hypothetical protein